MAQQDEIRIIATGIVSYVVHCKCAAAQTQAISRPSRTMTNWIPEVHVYGIPHGPVSQSALLGPNAKSFWLLKLLYCVKTQQLYTDQQQEKKKEKGCNYLGVQNLNRMAERSLYTDYVFLCVLCWLFYIVYYMYLFQEIFSICYFCLFGLCIILFGRRPDNVIWISSERWIDIIVRHSGNTLRQSPETAKLAQFQ